MTDWTLLGGLALLWLVMPGLAASGLILDDRGYRGLATSSMFAALGAFVAGIFVVTVALTSV